MPEEYLLDETTARMGTAFAVTLWRKYLQKGSESRTIGLQCRIWLSVLWSYTYRLCGMSPGTWSPTPEEWDVIDDACMYSASMPSGEVRRRCDQALMVLATYIRKADTNGHALQAYVTSRTTAVERGNAELRAMDGARAVAPTVRETAPQCSPGGTRSLPDRPH